MYIDLRKRHFWCFRGSLRGIFTKILYKKPWKIIYVRVEFAEYYRKIGFISTFNPMVKFPWPKNEKYRNWHNLMRKAGILDFDNGDKLKQLYPHCTPKDLGSQPSFWSLQFLKSKQWSFLVGLNFAPMKFYSIGCTPRTR